MRVVHTCSRRGCGKRPTYGVRGSRKRELCAKHALPGMINVDVARCDRPQIFHLLATAPHEVLVDAQETKKRIGRSSPLPRSFCSSGAVRCRIFRCNYLCKWQSVYVDVGVSLTTGFSACRLSPDTLHELFIVIVAVTKIVAHLPSVGRSFVATVFSRAVRLFQKKSSVRPWWFGFASTRDQTTTGAFSPTCAFFLNEGEEGRAIGTVRCSLPSEGGR